MRLLVAHQNFPGQFGHLVLAWAARPGWDVRGLGRDTAPGLQGFTSLTRYTLARVPRREQHPYLRQMEGATLHGQAAARAMLALKAAGFTPDVVLAHPGWGDALYARDIYPAARIVHFCEWYYDSDGADVGFDPEFPARFDDRARIRTWNALHALNLVNCDLAVTATRWQRSRHPLVFQPKIEVCHEGVAVAALGPDPKASLTLPAGNMLAAGDPVVTYVARNLEPYRGFHVLMRALAAIQDRHPRAHAIVIGGDDVSYGRRPKDAPNWREKMLAEVPLDRSRVHFLGRVPRPVFVKVLQISAAHVYLTYPFVLSWSLIEAMACGAPIVASDTAPVREILQDGRNARMVDFFAVAALADAVLETLARPAGIEAQIAAARADAAGFDHASGLSGYDRLLGIAAGG